MPSTITLNSPATWAAWDNTNSWVGGVVPVSGDTAILPTLTSVDFNGATISGVRIEAHGDIRGTGGKLTENMLIITYGTSVSLNGVTFDVGNASQRCVLRTHDGTITLDSCVSNGPWVFSFGADTSASIKGGNNMDNAANEWRCEPGSYVLVDTGMVVAGTFVVETNATIVVDDVTSAGTSLSGFVQVYSGGTLSFTNGADSSGASVWASLNASITGVTFFQDTEPNYTVGFDPTGSGVLDHGVYYAGKGGINNSGDRCEAPFIMDSTGNTQPSGVLDGSGNINLGPGGLDSVNAWWGPPFIMDNAGVAGVSGIITAIGSSAPYGLLTEAGTVYDSGALVSNGFSLDYFDTSRFLVINETNTAALGLTESTAANLLTGKTLTAADGATEWLGRLQPDNGDAGADPAPPIAN